MPELPSNDLKVFAGAVVSGTHERSNTNTADASRSTSSDWVRLPRTRLSDLRTFHGSLETSVDTYWRALSTREEVTRLMQDLEKRRQDDDDSVLRGFGDIMTALASFSIPDPRQEAVSEAYTAFEEALERARQSANTARGLRFKDQVAINQELGPTVLDLSMLLAYLEDSLNSLRAKCKEAVLEELKEMSNCLNEIKGVIDWVDTSETMFERENRSARAPTDASEVSNAVEAKRSPEATFEPQRTESEML